MVDKVKQGRKNRASGAEFERRTRKDLNDKGWIVDKWSNNVEWYFETEDIVKQENPIGRLAPAKRKYLGPGRPMVIGTGFPDFITLMHKGTHVDRYMFDIQPSSFYSLMVEDDDNWTKEEIADCAAMRKKEHKEREAKKEASKYEKYEVIGVECKTNGNLDKEEKEKCRWMLSHNIFGKILIASKTKVKNKIVITYTDFEEKYGVVTINGKAEIGNGY